MNEFHITGKVIFINPVSKNGFQGVTIHHYPDTIDDSFFELGIVFPKKIWESISLEVHDYIEIRGHYVSIDKSLAKKAKLVHVVDEVLDQVKE